MKPYTFTPKGNVMRSEELIGLGKWLLWVTEVERENRNLWTHKRELITDKGLSKISVLADKGNSSKIEIESQVPIQGRVIPLDESRELLLHCRVELTLAKEITGYEGDPSFIAVEPIPVSDDVITIHTTFEVTKMWGLEVLEVSYVEPHGSYKSDVFYNKTPEDNATEEPLTLDEAAELIEKYTDYRLVPKLEDFYSKVDTLLPSEAISGSTQFKDLQDSDFWGHQHTEYKTKDGYDYYYERDETTFNAMIGGLKWWEPINIYTSNFLTKDSAKNYIEDVIHSSQQVITSLNSTDSDITPSNPFPFGNINGEELRYRYSLNWDVESPFFSIVSDFTPRVGDKTPIWDIGKLATEQKSFFIIKENVETGELEKFYVDAKLFTSIFPYYVEAKDAKSIYEEYKDLVTDWGFYEDTPTPYLVSKLYTGINGFYTPNSCNWFLHPFRNEGWPTNLFDIRPVADIITEENNNPLFARHNMMMHPDYLFSDLPNRMILCVRSFFANTPTPTGFSGKRRAYGVKFPTLEVESDVWGHRPYNYEILNTYREVDVETSAPLSTKNCPNFVTEKGDLVIVNLLSSIYAVSDYDAITEEDLVLSPRHPGADLIEGQATPPSDVVLNQRTWPKTLDGDWSYTNIYGAGVTVSTIWYMAKRFHYFDTPRDITKAAISTHPAHKFIDRALLGESIFSDSEEDISKRVVVAPSTEVTWREEDTPESHLIHCIYRALKHKGFDIHRPICDIKLEVNLYDKY